MNFTLSLTLTLSYYPLSSPFNKLSTNIKKFSIIVKNKAILHEVKNYKVANFWSTFFYRFDRLDKSLYTWHMGKRNENLLGFWKKLINLFSKEKEAKNPWAQNLFNDLKRFGGQLIVMKMG